MICGRIKARMIAEGTLNPRLAGIKITFNNKFAVSGNFNVGSNAFGHLNRLLA